jgi:hypothetical protein
VGGVQGGIVRTPERDIVLELLRAAAPFARLARMFERAPDDAYQDCGPVRVYAYECRDLREAALTIESLLGLNVLPTEEADRQGD